MRDAFGLGVPKQSGQASMTHGNAICVCVAWSPICKPDGAEDEESLLREEKRNTIIAAAGSNGIVAIWNSEAFFPAEKGSLGNQQPEGYLNQHSRAVNSVSISLLLGSNLLQPLLLTHQSVPILIEVGLASETARSFADSLAGCYCETMGKARDCKTGRR